MRYNQVIFACTKKLELVIRVPLVSEYELKTIVKHEQRREGRKKKGEKNTMSDFSAPNSFVGNANLMTLTRELGERYVNRYLY